MFFDTLINNAAGIYRDTIARQENFRYSEQSAENADKRTRALYGDLYSPEAQMRQIKAAGLSPSIYSSGGLGGISGQAGAQGSGAAGISPSGIFGVDPMSIAQIGLINAQKNNLEADTNLKNEETESTKLSNELQSLENTKYGVDFSILTTAYNVNGETMSAAEIANNCTSFEQFQKRLYDIALNTGETELINNIKSEIGQRTLRDIFKANYKLKTEISILGEEDISAKFQSDIVNKLKSSEFAELNAKEAVQSLKTEIATEELTESQRDAWNKLIKELEEKNPTLAQIAIILGMIVDRFGGNVNMSVNRSSGNYNYKHTHSHTHTLKK